MEHLTERHRAAGEFYNFKLRNGQEIDCNDQGGEFEKLRRVILFLSEERNASVGKLRGLHAVEEVLRGNSEMYGKCDMSISQSDEIVATRSVQEATIRQNESTISTVTKQSLVSKHPQDFCCESSSNKENQNIIKGPCKECHLCDELQGTEDCGLLVNIAHTNHELKSELGLLRGPIQDQDNISDKVCPELCGKLSRLAVTTRQPEIDLRTKDVLCHSLAEQTDVMKDRTSQTKSARLPVSMTEKTATSHNGEVTNGANVSGETADVSQITRQDNRQILDPLGAEHKHLGREGNYNRESDDIKNRQNMDRNNTISGSNESEVINLEETVSKKKYDGVLREVNALRGQLQEVTEEKAKLKEHIEEVKAQRSKEQGVLQMQTNKLEQNCKHYQDVISQFHANEQSRKREVDQVLLHAKDCLERERQEKFASITEQKNLRQQLDNMSKSMKNMQVKNEEFVRLHCDHEDQVEDFKRLKKMIQEKGLPTIEQMISLQRQNETFREDLMNERKEKERLLSLKDKLKRDLDQSQSRISSLQEQVYKYREHIFFLQQKFKQDQGGLVSPGSGPPSSPLFEENVNQTQLLSGASKLYGSSAPQYINKQVLQGAVPPKYPLMPMNEKKPGPTRHGDGPSGGKPWQYQQGHYGKFGRQTSLDDWKRGPTGQGPQSPHQPPWESYYNSSQCQSGRLSSSSRSGSSVGSLEDMTENGHEQPPFVHSPRRQGPRPTMADRSSSDDGRGMVQGFGAPQQSAFEAWQSKQGFHMNRNQRRYSSPTSNGHGVRSNPTEFWPQQQNPNVPRAWQDASSYPDSPVSTSSSLRPGADPWLPTSQYVPSSSQSPTPCTSYGDTSTYMSTGFGSP